MGTEDRLLDSSAANVRANRGLNRFTQVMNLVACSLFLVFAVLILVRDGADGIGPALFCLALAALSGGAWWFRHAGTKRADLGKGEQSRP